MEARGRSAANDGRAGSVRRPPVVDALAFFSFFVFGSLTSLNDILMPKLKQLFLLSYGEMTLVQFCFFTSYALVSLPTAWLIGRVGYLRALASGFLLMGAGCALFAPAAASAEFGAFLGALFILAAGVTVVQVTANPLVIHLGTPPTTPTRLTFAHACNSIGTVVAPFVGAMLILGGASAPPTTPAARASAASSIGHTYLTIAAAVVVLSTTIWALRGRLGSAGRRALGSGAGFDLLRNRRVAFGVLAIGLYVGAEVTIGSLLVSYLELPGTMALTPVTAGKYLSFYWGGLLVGRLTGVGLLRRLPAPVMVTVYAGVAMTLVLASIASQGGFAGWALIAVGLFNSVLFPLIFALTTAGLGDRASEASGLLCVAIVGGAIVPLATGHLADATSLSSAFLVPAACYAGIAAFGFSSRGLAIETEASTASEGIGDDRPRRDSLTIEPNPPGEK